MSKKAILVGVNVGGRDEEFIYSMEELRNLTYACHMEVVGEVTQQLERIHQTYYIGSGKLSELTNVVAETGADVVIFDDELSPSQIRNLEDACDCEVMDRTMLILEIFASRAKTKEAQLQVEVARLKYMLPRLIGTGTELSRQGGGAGFKNRGLGEKKLELDRRKIEARIASLNKELEKIKEQRDTQRRSRRKKQIPVVSLVGYTNAGKSTIMNAMVEIFMDNKEKQVFEKNMLFATLDTSVRKIELDRHRIFLLTDTVGFINKLPHQLIKAFRSTLEEVLEADVIINVVDYSNPHHEEQKRLTNELLEELGVKDTPMIYAYNKADLTDAEYPQIRDNEIWLSAKKRTGILELSRMISQMIFTDFVQCEFLIPYTEGQIVSYLNEHGKVLQTDYHEEGTKMLVECSRKVTEQYKDYLLQIVH